MIKISLLAATILIGVVAYYSDFDVELKGTLIKKEAESFGFSVEDAPLFSALRKDK